LFVGPRLTIHSRNRSPRCLLFILLAGGPSGVGASIEVARWPLNVRSRGSGYSDAVVALEGNKGFKPL
jgi:hypothetical protein